MSDRGEPDPTEAYPNIWERPPSGQVPPGSTPPPPPPPPFDQGPSTEIMYGAPDDPTLASAAAAGGGGGDGFDGPGGPGGPDDGNWVYEPEYEPPPGPWWTQPGAIVAMAAGAATVVLGVIALIVFTGGDGDSTDNSLVPTPAGATTTTLPTQPAVTSGTTTTSVPVLVSTPAGPQPTSLATNPPPTQAPATTAAPTTTTSTTSTTVAPTTTAASTTTTVAPTTTRPGPAPTTTRPPTTTAAPTTTRPPTTTTEPPTTEAPTTTEPPTTEPPTTTTTTEPPTATTTTEPPTTTTTTEPPTTTTTTEPPTTTTSTTTSTTSTSTSTSTTTTTTTTTTVPLQPAGNIVADGDFAMFNQAVTTANMGQALEATGVTVLAPSDQAMRDVPNIDAILVDPSLSSQLVQAHLVNVSLDADAIFAQPSINGHPVDAASRTIAGDFGPVSISASDQASNGWVHTITRVLSAPTVTTAPTG